MYIHRPFLTLQSQVNSDIVDRHSSICVSTAQQSINIIYNALDHRHYFRSWWYNATHTLYASIIMLHVLLSDNLRHTAAGTHKGTLIGDVKKSLQILRAMDHMPIAIRYADLLDEILEVVLQHRGHESDATLVDPDHLPRNNGRNMAQVTSDTPRTVLISDRQSAVNPARQQETATPQLDVTGLARNDLLASLINPTALDDFAVEQQDFMFENIDGWNFAGNLCSDFNFNGENTHNAELWDWSERQ